MSFGPYVFTLRQLQYAVAVADALSFSKAAERCHVSQPSLSAQLAQLEEALGVRLFERDRRRVLATAAGRELIERARLILRDADDLVGLARRASDPLAGALRIGVIPTISPYLLPRVAPALRAAYPQLSVIWIEDKTEALRRALDAGALDAAIVALEAELGDVDLERIGADLFVLATPLGHPLGLRSAPVRAAELSDVDLLLLDEGHCLREQALTFCAHTRAHELEFRATSLSTLAQMVAGGGGVTLLPELAVATEAKRADLLIRRFAAPAPQRTLALIWRRRSPLAPALRQLASRARAAYAATATPRPRTDPKKQKRGQRAH